MSNDEKKDSLGKFVVGVAAVVTAGVILGALTAAGEAFVQVGKLEVRVEQLEHTAASPATIATMQTKLDEVARGVEQLGHKLDGLAERKNGGR